MKKRKVDVETMWVKDIKKMLKHFVSERNNGIHYSSQLPNACIPSGMGSGYSPIDKVVIKDLQSNEMVIERIEETLDLLLEHIGYMKEDLGEK